MNNNLNNSNCNFYKNKFSLYNPSFSLKNKNLDYCKKYSINNNKIGFNFYGNNNKCFLYSDYKPSDKFNNDLINNYSIKKFIKNKNQKDANINQQYNPRFYFKEINHYNLQSSNLINKKKTNNIQSCMKHCINNPNCNSITYFQEPMSCTFFDNVNLSKNKIKKYDTYILNKNYVKNNNSNNSHNNNSNNNINKKIKNHYVHKSNNSKYTKCFTNENHSNYNKLLNSYNNICKNNYGNEYVFKNDLNNKNILHCDQKKIKILCNPQFIEHFSNFTNNQKKFSFIFNNFYFKFSILIILLLLLFFFKK